MFHNHQKYKGQELFSIANKNSSNSDIDAMIIVIVQHKDGNKNWKSISKTIFIIIYLKNLKISEYPF